MDSLIGRTLSHYEITAELGRGGMGVVYRAHDTKLDRDVALKVLPAELLPDEAHRRRFIREAQTASQLEHPHIGVIHEIDEVDGIAFIAMELIRGEKLSEVIARGGLSPARALDLATEVAEGLARAHDAGVVHRDLKPANVMVTGDGHAKIIDFGLAKLLRAVTADTDETAPATTPGTVMGTTAYMSPEQARGQRVDHRSDIFSFGAMLFEILGGRSPFRGQTTVDTLHAILNDPPPPLPPFKSAVPTDVAGELERIVDKCLAKDPDARYQGLRDLVVDLRAARRRLESGTGRVPAAVAPAPAATARASWRLIAGGLVLVVALVAVGVVMWPRLRGTPPPPPLTASGKPSVAVLYFQNNTGSPQLDWLRTGLTDMVVTDLSQSPDTNVLSTDRLYQILAYLKRQNDPVISFDTVREVARLAGVQHVLIGNYIKAGETIRINVTLQDVTSGRILTAEHLEAANESQLFPTVDSLTRRLQTHLASTVASGAPTDLLKAPGASGGNGTTGLYRTLEEVTTSSVDAYRVYAQGVSLLESGRPRQAEPLLLKAIEIDPDFALAMVRLAAVENNLRRLDKSADYAQQALAHADRLSLRDRYYIEGFRYSRDEETEERGAAAYEKLLALYPQHYAGTHNLADLYFNAGRFEDSARLGEQLRLNSVVLPISLSNLAASYAFLDDLPKAQAVLDDYLRRFPGSADAYRSLGELMITFVKPAEAAAAFDQADAIDGGDPTWLSDRWAVAVLQDRWADAEAATTAQIRAADPFTAFSSVQTHALRELYRGRSTAALTILGKAKSVAATAGPTFDALLKLTEARTLLALGEPQQALAFAELARKLPGQAFLTPIGLSRYYLAVALTRLGRDAEARGPIGEIKARADVGFSPVERRRVHQLAGVLALDRHDTATAIDELRQAEGLLPPRSNSGPPPTQPEVWFALGSAYLAAGNDDEAEKRFSRLVDGAERVAYPIEYVRSIYFLGQIAERRGEADKARDYYRRFLTYWGDGEIDRDKVAEARKKIK
ncbi:MAG TPA: protein kinase [Vicinamibacterales bacterium]|nr:protein kinase [Vicinamibacterales bacterium]